MFERAIDYPCAIADQTDEGMATALSWLLEQKKHDEELTLWVPLKATLRNNDFLIDLARYEGRGLRIIAKDEVHHANGPVLAMYPDVENLAYVTAAAGISALAVVQWVDQLETWIQEVNAEVLHQLELDDDLPDYGEGPEPELVAAVVEGLDRITRAINHNNTIAGSGYEKDVTVRTLLQLHDRGFQLPAKRMAEWAVAHGWQHDNPKELINWVKKINSGTRPRTSRF